MPEAGLNSTCVEGRQRPGLALLGFRAGDCHAEIPSCRSVEELAWRAEVVRRADPNHILTSHSAIPSIFTLPGGSGQPDDWKMARTVDAYGTSFYPKHSANFEARDPSFRSAHLDAARSAVEGEPEGCIIEPRILEGIDAEGRAFKLLFGFNHGQDLANVIFKIKADGAEYLASDLKNQCPVPVETRDGRIILRQLLEPESVCVIKLVNRKGMA